MYERRESPGSVTNDFIDPLSRTLRSLPLLGHIPLSDFFSIRYDPYSMTTKQEKRQVSLCRLPLCIARRGYLIGSKCGKGEVGIHQRSPVSSIECSPYNCSNCSKPATSLVRLFTAVKPRNVSLQLNWSCQRENSSSSSPFNWLNKGRRQSLFLSLCLFLYFFLLHITIFIISIDTPISLFLLLCPGLFSDRSNSISSFYSHVQKPVCRLGKKVRFDDNIQQETDPSSCFVFFKVPLHIINLLSAHLPVTAQLYHQSRPDVAPTSVEDNYTLPTLINKIFKSRKLRLKFRFIRIFFEIEQFFLTVMQKRSLTIEIGWKHFTSSC